MENTSNSWEGEQLNREKFLEDYNEPLMQAVTFTYKGKRYCVEGYWAIVAYDNDGEERSIDNDIDLTREEALHYKAFDGGTKALIDIIEEITDVDFDF